MKRRSPMSDAGSVASRPKLSTGFSFEWEDQAREAFGYVPRLTAHTENEKHERKIDDRKLRACNRCKLLKTMDQFTEQGCNNCRDYIKPGAVDVQSKTTLNFEGMACVCTGNMQDSWVCRWQGLERSGLVPGAYAVAIKTDVLEDSDDDASYETEDEEDDTPAADAAAEAAAEADDEEVLAGIAQSVAPSAAVTASVAAGDQSTVGADLFASEAGGAGGDGASVKLEPKEEPTSVGGWQ